jgi:mannose-1-phosphate guanylyltransferase/mannose-6-phosphate isomerase
MNEYKIPEKKPEVTFVTRPWGFFHQYAHNEPVTVSLMTVQPYSRLSLQSHTRRSELWIALESNAVIQVGDTVFHAHAGEEFWIPAGVKHRLSAEGETVRVLEVAFGDWQQDDITRYEDDYSRPERETGSSS